MKNDETILEETYINKNFNYEKERKLEDKKPNYFYTNRILGNYVEEIDVEFDQFEKFYCFITKNEDFYEMKDYNLIFKYNANNYLLKLVNTLDVEYMEDFYLYDFEGKVMKEVTVGKNEKLFNFLFNVMEEIMIPKIKSTPKERLKYLLKGETNEK